MKIRQCFLELQLKMSGMFFSDTLYSCYTSYLAILITEYNRAAAVLGRNAADVHN